MEKEKKTILFCVSGGIAIYKILDVISYFRKKNYKTNVAMTKNACKLVSPITFSAISNNIALNDDFDPGKILAHIRLAEEADILIIAPATFNMIGKITSGIADDLVSTIVAAATCRKIIAPAMNVNMWNNDVLQKNILNLKGLGWEIIQPESGTLACGYEGMGRLASAENIIRHIEEGEPEDERAFLMGKRILITAGGTQEDIDPVRYITNRSSGKMGVSICRACQESGAEIALIHGRMAVPVPPDVKSFYTRSALEMNTTVHELLPEYDAIIMAAAVADYRPKNLSAQKIKKNQQGITLELEKNPDIVSGLSPKFKDKVIIGFAAESENLMENAATKLVAKNMDMIVANDISSKDAGFSVDNNRVTLIFKDGSHKYLPLMPKIEVARIIIRHLNDMLKQKES